MADPVVPVIDMHSVDCLACLFVSTLFVSIEVQKIVQQRVSPEESKVLVKIVECLLKDGKDISKITKEEQ